MKMWNLRMERQFWSFDMAHRFNNKYQSSSRKQWKRKKKWKSFSPNSTSLDDSQNSGTKSNRRPSPYEIAQLIGHTPRAYMVQNQELVSKNGLARIKPYIMVWLLIAKFANEQSQVHENHFIAYTLPTPTNLAARYLTAENILRSVKDTPESSA